MVHNSADASKKLSACLNILRRTPPGDAEENIADLATLLSADEDTAEELYQQADVPLGLGHAADGRSDGKPFIVSDHNRDGDSYRSPWSNLYNPPLPDGGFCPPDWLRNLEVRANELFDSYRGIYYGDGAVASVYLWDREGSTGSGSGFAGAFLIKKDVTNDKHVKKGYWNSMHVVDVTPSLGGGTVGTSSYGMTTTITVSMDPAAEGHGSTNVAGSLIRRTERICPIQTDMDHVANIGSMIEDVEIEMRSSMDSLSMQKTRFVVDSIRSGAKSGGKGGSGLGVEPQQHKIATMLTEAALERQANKGAGAR